MLLLTSLLLLTPLLLLAFLLLLLVRDVPNMLAAGDHSLAPAVACFSAASVFRDVTGTVYVLLLECLLLLTFLLILVSLLLLLDRDVPSMAIAGVHSVASTPAVTNVPAAVACLCMMFLLYLLLLASLLLLESLLRLHIRNVPVMSGVAGVPSAIKIPTFAGVPVTVACP